jgi:arginyl-tRNA--protein-N-Asp/Glu arginylyltransferase
MKKKFAIYYSNNQVMQSNWNRMAKITSLPFKPCDKIKAELSLRIALQNEFDKRPKEVLRKVLELNKDVGVKIR